MQWKKVLDNLSINLHVKPCRDVSLTQENNDDVYDYPIVFEDLISMMESWAVIFLQEVVYREANDDASKEELDVEKEQLCLCTLNSVDVYLPVKFNVFWPVEWDEIWETMLDHQSNQDDVLLGEWFDTWVPFNKVA